MTQLNQHTKWYTRWFITSYKYLKATVIVIGIPSIVIATSYTAGQFSTPTHVIANTIIQKESTSYSILEAIASCEGKTQFKSNGDVMRGKITPSDIGKYQINEPTWNDKARQLGFDIYTEQGNHDMAVYIFTHYGTDPWNSSKSCWSKKLN